MSMKWLAGLVLLAAIESAHAKVWMSRLDLAGWQLESSPGLCLLEQDIAGFGRLIFRQGSYSALSYELHSIQPLRPGEQAYMRIEAPDWQTAMPAQTSEQALLSPDAYERRLSTPGAELALAALHEGHQVRLSLPGGDNDQWWDVVASPVGFQEAWRGFMQCREALPHARPQPAPVVVADQPRPHKKTPAPAKPAPVRRPLPISSASQEWIKLREAGQRERLHIGRGKGKTALKGPLLLTFLAGQSSISKDLQDHLEALVQEWEIRKGEGRTMSLLIVEAAQPDTVALARQRLNAIHSYLLKRGLDPMRVHMRLDLHGGNSNNAVVTIGD